MTRVLFCSRRASTKHKLHPLQPFSPLMLIWAALHWWSLVSPHFSFPNFPKMSTSTHSQANACAQVACMPRHVYFPRPRLDLLGQSNNKRPFFDLDKK